MAKPKGSPKIGGRKKGTPNKFSRDLKEGVLAVWEKLEANGQGLEVEARKDPLWFYTNMLKPMLPKDVKVEGDQNLTIKIVRYSDGDNPT